MACPSTVQLRKPAQPAVPECQKRPSFSIHGESCDVQQLKSLPMYHENSPQPESLLARKSRMRRLIVREPRPPLRPNEVLRPRALAAFDGDCFHFLPPRKPTVGRATMLRLATGVKGSAPKF